MTLAGGYSESAPRERCQGASRIWNQQPDCSILSRRQQQLTIFSSAEVEIGTRKGRVVGFPKSPPDFARDHLARIDVARGRLSEAIAAFQSIGADRSLGHALAMAARSDEARMILRKLEQRARSEYVSPFVWRSSRLDSAIGMPRSIDSLERAFEIRAVDLSEVKVDSRFAPLAGEPRFSALLEKMGLTA